MAAVSSIALATLAVGSAYQSYDANQKMAFADERNAAENAKIMQIRAKEAVKLGEEQAGAYRLQAERLKGQQASTAAASGVVVGVGSQADIRAETEQLMMADMDRIKNNAMLEAWGYKTQGENLIKQSQYNQNAYRNQGNASLLGGIATAASFYKSGPAKPQGDGSFAGKGSRLGSFPTEGN